MIVMLCIMLAFIAPRVFSSGTPLSANAGEKQAEQGPGAQDGTADHGHGEVIELLGADVISGSSGKELQELQSLLDKNEEALDFVMGYPERARYREEEIDLTEDFVSGEVPLLMQWDRRWGYNLYGDSMIGLAGCGPTCLTMVYLYFTGDTSVNPRTMSEFAYENGYYVKGGTSWDLWTSGAERLGLHGEELPLDQNRMERALNNGSLIVCSMRPGDFTTTGHFILIYDYDENGFYVHDPNRRSNSEKQWTYDTIAGQIKNLWKLSKE